MGATLLAALQEKLDGSAVFAQFKASGGVWVGGVPEDLTKLPFLAIVHHDEIPDFGGPPGIMDERGSFDLVVVGKQPLSAAEALAGQIKAILDPVPSRDPEGRVELTITGAALAFVERAGYRVERLPQRTADGGYAYQITMPFRSFVTRHAS